MRRRDRGRRAAPHRSPRRRGRGGGESVDVADAPDFAVEDLLAAGAVVDALTEVGIDHTSPEAAAACAAYTGLRRAVRHLVSASEGAAVLSRDDVHAALAAGPDLPVLRESGERA